MHRKVAAALVAALALVIASCGGSEESLTRAQLVRRVELACRQGQEESQRQMRASRASESDTPAFVDAVLAGQKKQLDEIDDLDVPDAVQADFDAFKDGVQARIDAIERVATADRADVQRAIRAVQAEAEAASRRVTEAARRLNVEGCG